MMRTLTLLLVATFGFCGPLLAQTISATIAVTGGTNPTCAGRTVTFTAYPTNAGFLPNYQWYINGIPVPGATGGSFITNSLMHGDSVYVEVERSFTPFDSAFSPAIHMVVVPNVTPVVTKAITAGANPGCIDSLIQFTATPTNGGVSPTYRWYINGVAVGVGQTYNNTTADSGDRIWVRMIASGAPVACYTNDTAYSDTTVLIRKPTPASPSISFIGHNLISDSANVQWYGPAGIIPGATGPIYRPTVQGSYYALIPSPLCGTGRSNILIVFPLNVPNTLPGGAELYPNPTSGLIQISWARPTTARINVLTATGQSVLQDVATVTMRKTVDLSRLAAGTYFLSVQDEQGQKGSTRITVTR